MKDAAEMERKRGTTEELDPGTDDGRRNAGTDTQLDPQTDIDTGDDENADDAEDDEDEEEAGQAHKPRDSSAIDTRGHLTNRELGEE